MFKKEKKSHEKWLSKEPGKLDPSTLRDLCRKQENCVQQTRKVVHLALPFSALKDVMSGVHAELSQHINRYYSPVGGILVGYEKPQLTASTGSLLADQAYVHLDVSADFFIFCPRVGSVLAGQVVKRSAGHVGCLIFNTFNISMRAGRDYMTAVEGDSVKIEVTGIEHGSMRSLPVLEGKLVNEEYDSGISSPDSFQNSGEKRTRDTEGNLEGEPSLKRAKTMFNENNTSKDFDEVSPELTMNTEGIKDKPKKKKKKKDKELSQEFDNANVDTITEDLFENIVAENKDLVDMCTEVKKENDVLGKEYIEPENNRSKKKKKNKKNSLDLVENVVPENRDVEELSTEIKKENDTLGNEYIEPEDDRSKKKKKKNKKNSLDPNDSTAKSTGQSDLSIGDDYVDPVQIKIEDSTDVKFTSYNEPLDLLSSVSAYKKKKKKKSKDV